jgi:hypothetical protein
MYRLPSTLWEKKESTKKPSLKAVAVMYEFVQGDFFCAERSDEILDFKQLHCCFSVFEGRGRPGSCGSHKDVLKMFLLAINYIQ